MINVARKMEERYGIPFFEGFLYGITDSSDSLREIARLLIERGAPDELMGRTEAVIAREEARAWAAIAPYKPRFKGKKVLLITAVSNPGRFLLPCKKQDSNLSAPA